MNARLTFSLSGESSLSFLANAAEQETGGASRPNLFNFSRCIVLVRAAVLWLCCPRSLVRSAATLQLRTSLTLCRTTKAWTSLLTGGAALLVLLLLKLQGRTKHGNLTVRMALIVQEMMTGTSYVTLMWTLMTLGVVRRHPGRLRHSRHSQLRILRSQPVQAQPFLLRCCSLAQVLQVCFVALELFMINWLLQAMRQNMVEAAKANTGAMPMRQANPASREPPHRMPCPWSTLSMWWRCILSLFRFPAGARLIGAKPVLMWQL